MEHLTEEQIASYRARSLAASDVLPVSDHLLECDVCRARVSEEAALAASASTLRQRLSAEAAAFAHLTYDEIAAYVDRTAGDSQIQRVDRHMRACAACASDVRDLRILRAELDLDRAQAARPRGLSRFWPVFALAAAAACVLITVAIVRRPGPRLVAKVEAPRPQQPAPPAAIIQDGNRQIAIGPQGTVAGLDGLPPEIRDAVEHALATQRVDTPASLASLTAKRDVLLGAPAPARGTGLLDPVGRIVESQTPVFHWKPAAGAEYRVGVYTEDFQEAAASGWIREPQWRTPVALPRGTRYSWQVTVRRDGSEFTSPAPPEPEARFQVLDAASEAGLAELRTTSKDSHLVLGVAYARAGLISEAREELRAAAGQNPGSPVLAAILDSFSSDRRQSK
ncbi:MAG TPA: hypothetical protein VMH28_12220 [Candidatus Acidoferrales bacterium]|nr:hypothetical protein [Candidatus Acidoferrales bacterium]